MAIDPIAIARDIQRDFRRYLRTTLSIAPKYADLRNQFHAALEQRDVLFKGPYLQGLPPYEPGESLNDLVEARVLPSAIRSIPFLGDATYPLYWHQAEAVKQVRRGHNVIMASGTGSGKTLAFLVPIISSILENPAPGVHALLLYPMNALVNDQLKVLRRLLRGREDVRFGRYVNIKITPEREREARRLYPEALPNEVVSREQFREEPPHILITNYAMLEYLLLRPDDSPLFRGPWRFIVVDELHTYSGARGGEIAFLMRRLRQRVKDSDNDRIQYIGTSATIVSTSATAPQRVADFATTIFDAPFDAKGIIQARAAYAHPTGPQMPPPDEALYRDTDLLSACDRLEWDEAARTAMIRNGVPVSVVEQAIARYQADFEAALYDIFSRDPRIQKLRSVVSRPVSMEQATAHVFGKADAASVQSLVGLVRICSLARLPGGEGRLAPCRYHMFCRGLDGLYVALTRSEKAGALKPTLLTRPMRLGPDGKTRVLELCTCRKCGQPYLCAYEFAEDDEWILKPFGSPSEGRGEQIWLVWQPPRPECEDEEDESEPAVVKSEEIIFCTQCGRYGPACQPLRCSCPSTGAHIALWVVSRRQRPRKCFACGSGNSITAFRTDGEAAQAVVAETFYRGLPPSSNSSARYYPGQGRKLLAFADSRQSAAYFAPYLERTHKEQKLRWLILRAFKSAVQMAGPLVAFADLLDHMVSLGRSKKLFPLDWTTATARTECARYLVREFCLPTGRRLSLEALGLLRGLVDLSEMYVVPPVLASFGLHAGEAVDLVQEILSTLRLQKAITMPPPLVATDEDFKPRIGEDAVVSIGTEELRGGRLWGFLPSRSVRTQRRSAYLKRVLDAAAKREGLRPPSKDATKDVLDAIWRSVTDIDGPAELLPFARAEVTPGKIGYQIRWEALRFSSPAEWYRCNTCNQWYGSNVLSVCPSFRCTGRLVPASPDDHLADHHYRRFYTSGLPTPLRAKEHTAQLSAELAARYQQAFQEGHSRDEGQINVLSCSTTFELGVDLGDLEAVLLRGVPPSPANYQQRAGRAGRGVGAAAFVVTFALNRSHDATFFERPEAMIMGEIRPPRASPEREVLRRHLNAVLLSQFAREWRETQGREFRSIGDFLESTPDLPSPPYDAFLKRLDALIESLRTKLMQLVSAALKDAEAHAYLSRLADQVKEDVNEARAYYLDERKALEDILREKRRQWNKLRRDGKPAGKLSGFMDYVQRRIDDLRRTNWVTFFSDRNVLPRYAFPIYNVSLETPEAELRLERDLKIALGEYAPGATLVAKDRLWESVAVRLPPNRALPRKYYARCPQCWHVERHLKKEEVFKDRRAGCPVCGHDGRSPKRGTYQYIVPKYGFSTDLQQGGRPIIFDRPMSVPASRVLFVPQPNVRDDPGLVLGSVPHAGVEVRGSEGADFFVFNNGNDGSGRGFYLCTSCGRLLDYPDRGSHLTVTGKECKGKGSWKHLGHEFRGTATRLLFTGTGHRYDNHAFWLSLMYALLGGMSDALEVERGDIDGVIRPVSHGGTTTQEVVLFDNVPGGAGHVRRLLDQEELIQVIGAAYGRSSQCQCGEDTSCYSCLRCYRNQYCHDLLQRGLAASYLGQLISETGGSIRE